MVRLRQMDQDSTLVLYSDLVLVSKHLAPAGYILTSTHGPVLSAHQASALDLFRDFSSLEFGFRRYTPSITTATTTTTTTAATAATTPTPTPTPTPTTTPTPTPTTTTTTTTTAPTTTPLTHMDRLVSSFSRSSEAGHGVCWQKAFMFRLSSARGRP